MKNKGNVLTARSASWQDSLSCTGSAERNMALRMSFTSPMFKKVMQRIGLAVSLFPIIK